ncbi:MAG: glycosyltransferase family 39 protein [Pseudomonadota bacterium]|nr:glycosyltransferase family 39 protein [Pseudomonadota bacterium]
MTDLARGPRAYFILAAIAALAALAGLFTLPPLDRDESRFAQATAQMLETGNFVEINFQDEERNKKPVGIHWLQAASVAALSSAEAREIWAYRIPSMFGAILAALACFWGGQRLVGREAAFAGAALLAASVMLGIEGGIAKTDAVMTGATTLALAALAHLRTGGGRRTALLFWFALGLGTLVKGPVTPMVAGLATLTLLVWEREWRWLKPLFFWPGPLLAACMVLPWLVSIQIATEGNFLREAVGMDMGPKIISAQERHGGWPGYYLLALPLTFFPAILFFIPGLTRLIPAVRGRIDAETARKARFLIAWALPSWLVFELMPTKLPHYVLPTYPALALIAGWGFAELSNTANWARWTGWALFGLSGLIAALGASLIFMLFTAPGPGDPDPLRSAMALAAASLFAGLAGATLAADRLRKGMLVLVLAVLSGLGWHVMVRGTALPGAEAVRLADRVRAVREMSGEIAGLAPEDIVTASSYTEPSLVFSLGTDTHLGTAEDVFAFAESRDLPTLMVLDLSRDDALRAAFDGERIADGPRPEYDLFGRLGALGDCHREWIPGTNYSRGGDTTLVAVFTRCRTGAPQTPELDDQ